MRRRQNPSFTSEQIEEIEDRVNNLIQTPLLVLELLGSGEQADPSLIETAHYDLHRLTRWVRSLHPEQERYHGR